MSVTKQIMQENATPSAPNLRAVDSLCSLVHDHRATLHHPSHLVDDDVDITQWVALDGHDVGIESRCDFTKLSRHAEQFGGIRRGRGECLRG